MKNIGQASSSRCPKGGIVWLHVKTGQVLALETVCKTYQCLGCRDRRLSLFKLRVVIGCSIGKRSAFITVTLKPRDSCLNLVRLWIATGKSPTNPCIARKDARFVRAALRRFWWQMKAQPALNAIEWLMVPELTKRGTPHLHIIMTNLGGMTIQDLGREVQTAWSMATRENHQVVSFITDTRAVYSTTGAGSYLAKYLVKGQRHREELARLGFTRRFSRSPGWPSDEPLRRKGTELEKWTKVVWTAGVSDLGLQEIRRTAAHPLLERVGGRHYLAMADRAKRNGLISRMERMVQAIESVS